MARAASAPDLNTPGTVAAGLGLIALVIGGAMVMFGIWSPTPPPGIALAGAVAIVMGWMGLGGGLWIRNSYLRRKGARPGANDA